MIFPNKEFNKISCKEAFVNKQALIELFTEINQEKINIHQMILLHQGSMVFEAYAQNHQDKKENVYSISKSFTSIAIGILIDQNILTLDDYVLDYFKNDLYDFDSRYEKLQLKHLLTMTSGQNHDKFHGLMPEHNPLEIYFNTNLRYEPGSKFFYSNFDSLILSILVTKITGQKLNVFLNEHLYKKIGLENIMWDDLGDYSKGCTGLRLSGKDLARFGLLLLNDGLWKDEQIISKSYLELALNKQVSTTTELNKLNRFGYGYQFWINDFGDYKAAGLYNQLLIINKEYQLVFALTAYEDRPLTELFRKYVLSGFKTGYHETQRSLKPEISTFTSQSLELLKIEEKTRID